MPRIRTIKPDLFRHDGLFDAEASSGMPLRLAYTGLFTICDREGRFRWEPRRIKVDVFPYDEIDMEDILLALEQYGFVRWYTDGEREYGEIPTFTDHQMINGKERDSVLPAIEECETRSTPDVLGRGKGTGKGIGKGKGKGKGNTRAPRVPHARVTRKPRDADASSTRTSHEVADSFVSMQLAQYLYDAIRTHDPDFKLGGTMKAQEEKLIRWSKEIDKAIRIDNKTEEQIREVIDFAHKSEAGSFWRSNILSGQKLRKQLSRLLIQKKTAAPTETAFDAVMRNGIGAVT